MTTIDRWLVEPLPKNVARAIERLASAPGVVRIAVMPDVHLAEHVCVGTVLGTDEVVYPQGVGGDIGCGVAAVRLTAGADALASTETADELLAELRQRVPAIRHRQARAAELLPLSDPGLQRRVARDARVQLGTLGRGNHFVELQADDEERLWLTVHTGSRGLGPAVRDHHLALASGSKRAARLVGLAVDGPGADYVHDADVAIDYARRNRRAIAENIAPALTAMLGADIEWDTWFENAHDSVRRETHGGQPLWVHRKGASPAGENERGIIPGSMGTASFHVVGRGCAAAMCSSSHGAGRRLRRGEAARAFSVRELARQMRGVHYEHGLAPRLRDEAPLAYKDIAAVMRAQRELVRIVRRLRPVLAYKAG